MAVLKLCEMVPGQEADLFVLMTAKEQLTTREGKPFFKVGFRDSGREVTFPVWDNSPLAAQCREQWNPGVFYKLRAVYRETNYGPQLDIRKIREVCEGDAADGFDPTMCLPQSRFDPQAMFEELLAVVREEISEPPLKALVESLLEDNRAALLRMPAARHNHHAFVGGLLEHTLSVTRSCLYLAAKYAEYYHEMRPPLDRSLVVAGAILHDIGKLRELDQHPGGTVYAAAGAMIGHLLLGRDMVREAAAKTPLPGDMLLRLEHLIIAHQRLPEWGSPKPPMTPEALIVHYADDLDAKYAMMAEILRNDANPGPVTAKKNVLMQHVYRGPG
ncbi:MAG: HD domain-containing protein [Thermoguttaceae bacterium]|jgi:3'-5' exoribonuclease